MASKWLPTFKKQIALLKAGDVGGENEKFVRTVMAGFMENCPTELLIRVGEMIAESHAEEQRRFDEQN